MSTQSLTRWYDARRGGRSVVLSWLVTRVLILVVLATVERFVVGDVFYYWRKITGAVRTPAWPAP